MTERLDRVEAILERLAERQDQMQVQQDRMQVQQDRMQVQQDRFQQQLEETRHQSRSLVSELAEDVVSMISSLAENQTQTQMQLDALSAHVSAYIAQSSAFLAVERHDRGEFRQQMIGLQTETRNILRELADMRRLP